MIPSAQEVLSAVYGAWTLFKLDPRGLAFFEDSVPAFWRSFFAAVIVAPGVAVLRVMDHIESGHTADPLGIAVVEVFAYVVVWAGFPLALYYLARGFDREKRYLLAVVALNWSTVIQIAVSLPIHLIAASGVLTPGLATLAVVAVLIVTLFYEGFVARTALQVTAPLAAVVVGVDVAIGVAVQVWVNRIVA